MRNSKNKAMRYKYDNAFEVYFEEENIMRTSSTNFLERMDENEISKLIFKGHFDGAVLIDSTNDRTIPISDYMTGNIKKFIDIDAPYSVSMEKFIDKLVLTVNKELLKAKVSLNKIKTNLDDCGKYNVNVRIKSDCDDNLLLKRLYFQYLDDKREIILLVCKDMSNIILSDIDPLTGIYDSTGFHKRVKEWLENNPGKKYRIQRYNIDRFRDINGIYGYAVGNKLLRDFGQYMKKLDTKDSFSAHLNADHFVRFCAEDVLSVEEYCEALHNSFKDYGLKMPITIHMGVYDLCEPSCNSFNMSYKALLALQSLKGKYNEPIAYYKEGMIDIEIEQQELLNRMDKAIENDEFEVWFQPQVNYKNKEMIGAEALIRWRHPEKGLILPKEFLPVFESSNRIGEVDKHIIDKVCRYMHKWMEKMPEKKIIVSVNLSRSYMQKQDFVKKLKAVAEKHSVPASNIHLEITESAYMENPEVLIEVVKELRTEGFIVEMDDFGSAYSSLNILKDIEIDVLKLDMKFLSDAQRSKKSKIIISSIISMASALGIPVLAEGVEEKEQADMLLEFGCERMQGFYFCKPVPANEYERMIKNDGFFGISNK